MIEIVPLRPEDEGRILSWRNDPDVARYMYRDTPIAPDEHARWFLSAMDDRDTAIHRMVILDGDPVGVSSLTSIDRSTSECEWGGYLAPTIARGDGIGRQMLEASLKVAFVDLDLERVFVEVITTNERAISLYNSMGFEMVETIPGRAVQSTGTVDAHRLVITRSLSRLDL